MSAWERHSGVSPGAPNSCYGDSDIPTSKYCPICLNFAQSLSGVEKLSYIQRRGCRGDLDKIKHKMKPAVLSAWRKEAADERFSRRSSRRRRLSA